VSEDRHTRQLQVPSEKFQIAGVIAELIPVVIQRRITAPAATRIDNEQPERTMEPS
jgi:hypothetical protein